MAVMEHAVAKPDGYAGAVNPPLASLDAHVSHITAQQALSFPPF